jgi:SAM-dependent methyltransferase
VTGIEYDAQSAEHAREWLEQLVIANLEHADWLECIAGRFDIILAADVIEHLRNPAAVLRQFGDLLGDEGELVISVPNVGHAGVIAELLCGHFDYKETGILDETHLRFYTWKSLEAQLNEAGFEVVHRETVNAPGSHEQFFGHWVKLPVAMREMLERHPLANVFQYVVKARRSLNPVRLSTGDDESLDAWFNRA